MRDMLRDLRHGLRLLAMTRGYTAVAAIALALGIGANTAVFSVTDALLLKSVAVPTTERLVMMLEQRPNETIEGNTVSPANYNDWRQQSHSFDRMSAFGRANFTFSGGGANPEHVEGANTTADFFTTLSAQAALGRTFLPEEGTAGLQQVVILSHNLWQQHFGADREIIGKTVRLNARPYTVIGVMPRSFAFPVAVEAWAPLVLDSKALGNRAEHSLEIVARLRPGVSPRQALAEMRTITSWLSDQYPATNRGWSVQLTPIREAVTGYYTHQYTLLLLYAVTFVLLIACANVANLQYARMSARSRELALRGALGASRWRLIRQLLTESVLVSLLGSALGIAVAEVSVKLILAYMPAEVGRWVPGWYEIHLDLRSFAYALAIAVAAGIVAGVAPAIYAASRDANQALKEGSRGASADRGRVRSRAALLVIEVTLAVVLLVGAGLMVKGTRALSDVNGNFQPASILTAQVTLPAARYAGGRQVAGFFDEALQRLSAIPQVKSAALCSAVPFGPVEASQFSVEGRVEPAGGEYHLAFLQDISPSYFATVNIPVIEGRLFTEADGPDQPRVAIVSHNLAARFWPGKSPLGRRLKVGAKDSSEPWLTVVGVAGDVRHDPYAHDILPALYRPYRQSPRSWATFALRVSGDPSKVVAAARQQIASLDPDLPLHDLMTMDRVIHNQILGLAYVAVMLAIMGAIALVLSCVGLFAVMAYSVSERIHEFGIRLALGARRWDLLRMIVGRGMALTSLGLAFGVALSAALARSLSQLIYGVKALDLATFAGVVALLGGVALFACYVPGYRAAHVEPMRALKYE